LVRVIGAIRICGRWISQEILKRLSRRTQNVPPPPRRTLVAEFCRAVGWHDAQGQPCLSAASVALRKLEARGQVKLPPLPAKTPGDLPRGLKDDGQPLPALPALPTQGPVPGLRLRLVQDEHDPAHRLWNRLMVREHPLGRAPLVGAQLRYVVEGDAGVVGALGFGPAAYHLACRDFWIGWTPAAREQHRPRVIGLARFLIRPGLTAPNLASQCYGLGLARVADDWQARYGIRPVLVETYVERSAHAGRSLAAANWRRLGQSQGRGRDDPHRQHDRSPKDVWVYELDPQARAPLQAQPVERLVPRSVFAPPVVEDWVEEELADLALGDERLNQRARDMLRGRWAHPERSFYRSFGSAAQGKGAYRLVESPRADLTLATLLAPHQLQTARRMAAEAVVFMAQDTTGLSYLSLRATEGLGPLEEEDTRGLWLHSLQAFRLDGIPLGTAWAEVWARPEVSDTAQRNDQSIDQKESARWVRALHVARERARQMPQTQMIVCGDRESDLYELYDQMEAAPPNLHVLVRGQHDRTLQDGRSLRTTLAATTVGGRMTVEVPRRQDRPARTATLELRWLTVTIQPPAVALKKSWPPLTLTVVWAHEGEAPVAAEPIDWLLVTTWPVSTLKMACRLVGWYALRWGIECWHKVLKGVAGVERRQFKTALALERALALDMIVAARVLLLTRLGKAHPELPAELCYTPEELAVLARIIRPPVAAAGPSASGVEVSAATAEPPTGSPDGPLPTAAEPSGLTVKKKEEVPRAASPKLTVGQANLMVAMLAGFWGRKGDGAPGAQILAEGMMLLQVLVWYERRRTSSGGGNRRNSGPT
jgi:hypothetical protein